MKVGRLHVAIGRRWRRCVAGKGRAAALRLVQTKRRRGRCREREGEEENEVASVKRCHAPNFYKNKNSQWEHDNLIIKNYLGIYLQISK